MTQTIRTAIVGPKIGSTLTHPELSMPAKSVKKLGRPSPYKDGFSASFPELGYRLALLGLKDKEIAATFGIAESTLSKWKNDHPEFSEALNAGKAPADAQVVARLYQRAMGYEHDEIDIRVINGVPVQTLVRKHYPPDTTACIFWLKNRQRENWRDKVETGVTTKDGQDVKPVDLLETARRLGFILAQADHLVEQKWSPSGRRSGSAGSDRSRRS
jgi:hypothetical protein